jgi:hypothetical protein
MIGPILCITGAVALTGAVVVHGLLRWPTILTNRPEHDERAPTVPERVSVQLLVYGVWAVVFGAVVWRGVPDRMMDVRFSFERSWPVLEAAEWIYLSVYVVPLTLAWWPVSRATLRRYAIHVWWLLAISTACFLLLPFGAPPRPFVPTSLAGRILAWETGRPDFAAASLPSFHVFWGLLVASALATRDAASAWLGRGWAAAVAISCIATGAHALADVAASLVIYALVGEFLGVRLRRPAARPIRNPTIAPIASPPSPK